MFSVNQKRQIADAVQQILRNTSHPELPAGEIQFRLHVDWSQSWSWADIKNNGAVIKSGVNPWNEAQAVLSTPQPPADGKAADRLDRYDQALSAVMPSDFKDWWQNSKDEWPDVAAAVIESLRKREELAWEQAERLSLSQPVPVNVSERLPGPEDCLEEGWAWFFSPLVGWRQAVLPVSAKYTHWLPAHALPLPGQEVER